MSKIAKKSRSVKRGNPPKQAKPARYTIRKDSLDRRYAIDKRTGKRVAVSKAKDEQARRRKASIPVKKTKVVFHRIKPEKTPKPKKVRVSREKRSEAAKRGWETRRAKVAQVRFTPARTVFTGWAPHALGTWRIQPLVVPEPLAKPEEILHHGVFDKEYVVVGGIADRARIYPKVQIAADEALERNQLRLLLRRKAAREKKRLPAEPTRFDRDYGADLMQVYRDHLGRAGDLNMVDQRIAELFENPENDMSIRELYTLYFSPEP